MEIVPGVGLGPLRFGMSEAVVQEILGSPEEIAEFVEGDRHLYYEWRGVTLAFDGDDGGRLSSIEVDSNCQCSLFGEPLFPKSRDQVVTLLQRSLLPGSFDALKEEEHESLEQILLRVPSLGADFHFDLDENLEELLWAPLVGSDDEVVWPGEA